MLSQVEVNHRKQEPIPVGWGINKDGKVGEHGCNKTYVTGPAKIDHVSANYTELYFR